MTGLFSVYTIGFFYYFFLSPFILNNNLDVEEKGKKSIWEETPGKEVFYMFLATSSSWVFNVVKVMDR